MRSLPVFGLACGTAIWLLTPAASLAAETAAAVFGIFDTGSSSSAPLASEAWASRAAWSQLKEDETAHAFRGDAVLANDRIAVVFRRGGAGAEVYAAAPAAVLRAVLAPVADRPQIKAVAAVDNSASAAAVEATFAAADGKEALVRFEIQPGQVFVKTDARGGAERLRLEAPCRFALLPDFFAADIAIDAAELAADRAELPSENFFLHLVGSGEALVVATWNQREEEIQVALSGRGEARTIRSSEIPYGRKGSVFVAVLEGPGIWHQHPVSKADAGQIVPLDWRAPFPADWRMDWRQDDGLTDSWQMLVERPDGTFEKADWFGQQDAYGNLDWMQGERKRWTTVLGFFQYPCWIDRQGQGFIQPLKKPGNFQGPAILYPVNRVSATPLTALTFVDVVRGTLGVGPCQYVLDVEGQQKRSAGRPTCDVRTRLNAIYAANRQVPQRADVERALDDVLAFMQHIRGRIEDYATFGRELRAYLEEQKNAQPELAGFLGEMDLLARRIDAALAQRSRSIGTPEYAKQLVDEFRATLVGYQGDDALSRCQKITSAFVQIGGNQDELVGECRLAVRILRQKAAWAMAADPRTAGVAQEIRRRTHAMLRNPTSYEAPRH